jgi:hypothetical protein
MAYLQPNQKIRNYIPKYSKQKIRQSSICRQGPTLRCSGLGLRPRGKAAEFLKIA